MCKISSKEVKRIENELKKVSPDESKAFLKSEGILDKEGRLTEYGEDFLGTIASQVSDHAE